MPLAFRRVKIDHVMVQIRQRGEHDHLIAKDLQQEGPIRRLIVGDHRQRLVDRTVHFPLEVRQATRDRLAIPTPPPLKSLDQQASPSRRLRIFSSLASTTRCHPSPLPELMRRRQRSYSTVQSFCLTFSDRLVGPPSYTLASSFAT